MRVVDGFGVLDGGEVLAEEFEDHGSAGGRADQAMEGFGDAVFALASVGNVQVAGPVCGKRGGRGEFFAKLRIGNDAGVANGEAADGRGDGDIIGEAHQRDAGLILLGGAVEDELIDINGAAVEFDVAVGGCGDFAPGLEVEPGRPGTGLVDADFEDDAGAFGGGGVEGGDEIGEVEFGFDLRAGPGAEARVGGFAVTEDYARGRVGVDVGVEKRA